MAAVAQVNDVARGPFVLIGFRQFKKCLHFCPRSLLTLYM